MAGKISKSYQCADYWGKTGFAVAAVALGKTSLIVISKDGFLTTELPSTSLTIFPREKQLYRYVEMVWIVVYEHQIHGEPCCRPKRYSMLGRFEYRV